ncbi:hypothetical protein ACSBR1_030406 [Camellia fascicularis]
MLMLLGFWSRTDSDITWLVGNVAAFMQCGLFFILNLHAGPHFAPPSFLLVGFEMYDSPNTTFLYFLQVIANSVSLLNPSDVIKLLNSLIAIIQSRGSNGGNKTVTGILSGQPILFKTL